MKYETRFKTLKLVIWAVSACAFIGGLVFTTDRNLSPTYQLYANILLQAGGAFFFALTVGWVIDRVRDIEGYSVLWLFSQEFRKAGVLAFYADREGYAKQALEEAFEKHSGGEVLMAGASLRLFLGSGLHFYDSVSKILSRRGGSPITVRAVSSSPETNHELPLRSFVEEFNQDRSSPRSPKSFDWTRDIDFSFAEFEQQFFEKYGINTPSCQRARVVKDLDNVRGGVRALEGVAQSAGNFIKHRESRFAPYCTVIIFPDRAFYTPNLLGHVVPINFPLIVFHRSSDAYDKLVNYVEFLWWVSNPAVEAENV